MFKAIIPRNTRLAEAPSFGMPGVVYDPVSTGSQAYQSFAKELIERVKQDHAQDLAKQQGRVVNI